VPQEKVKEHQIWRHERPESGLSSAKPALGQLLVKNIVTSMWICGGVTV